MTIQANSDQSDPSLKFKKEMETRHIVMLALGGVIGTGLFLTSGYTVNQAGPLGAVIAYIIGAVMVYLVMVCLGELAVQMPETGSFSSYATRYLGPGTGYTDGGLAVLAHVGSRHWFGVHGGGHPDGSLVSRHARVDLERAVCHCGVLEQRGVCPSFCRNRVLALAHQSLDRDYVYRHWWRCYLRSLPGPESTGCRAF